MRPVRGYLILLGCFGFATSRTPGLHSRVTELVKTSCALSGSASTSGPETKRLGMALVVSTPLFANELIKDEDETTRADGAVMLPPAVLEDGAKGPLLVLLCNDPGDASLISTCAGASDVIVFTLELSDTLRGPKEAAETLRPVLEAVRKSKEFEEKLGAEYVRKRQLCVVIQEASSSEAKPLEQFEEAVKDLIGSEMQVSFNLLPPKILEENSKRKREMSIIGRAMQSSVLTKDEEDDDRANLLGVLEWLKKCEKDAKKGCTAAAAGRRRSDATTYFADIAAEKVFKAACVEIDKLQDVAPDEFGARADALIEDTLVSFERIWEELAKLPSSKAKKLLASHTAELKSSLNLSLRREHAKHLVTVRNAAIKRFHEISVPIKVIGASTKELRFPLQEADKYFCRKTLKLNGKYFSFPCGAEHQAFLRDLREIVADRMQSAYLARGFCRERFRNIRCSVAWLIPSIPKLIWNRPARLDWLVPQLPKKFKMPDGEPGVPEDGVGADRLIFDYDPCIKIPAPVGGEKRRPKNWDKLLDRLDETERLVYTRDKDVYGDQSAKTWQKLQGRGEEFY